MELFPHQKKAVEDLSNGKILYGGVGTGKSVTAIEYYMRNESPKPLYVITTAKKRDSLEWMEDAAYFGVGITEDTTVAGVMTVDSWNNIGKYKDVEDSFFIFDEQKLVGSGAWVKAFRHITKRNNWILLSATPGDTWMDYVPVFVANGLFDNPTQFKREHVVYRPFTKYPQIQRYLNEGTLEKYRNMLLVEMPYIKHTKPEDHLVQVEYDQTALANAIKTRWNPYTEEPMEDAAELFRVLRQLVNSDPSRVAFIRELLRTSPKLVIYYNYNYELDILRSLGDQVTVGEWNGHKKTPIPETDSWVYLVQYRSGAEGWNCVETNTMVMYSLTYSHRDFEQAKGRIDRLDSPFVDLHYYILKSNSLPDSAVWGSLKKKKLFNERRFASQLFSKSENDSDLTSG